MDILPAQEIVERLHRINPEGIPKWNPSPSRLRAPEVAL